MAKAAHGRARSARWGPSRGRVRLKRTCPQPATPVRETTTRRPRPGGHSARDGDREAMAPETATGRPWRPRRRPGGQDRKSTRLNSSHVAISYAVFCLKKKKINQTTTRHARHDESNRTAI